MNPLLIGGIVDAIGNIADDLFTSDKERLDAQIELKKLGIEEAKIEASLLTGQQETNKVEAASKSMFVSGWRPAIGWVCASALFYQFILYPLMVWSWAAMQAKGWIPAELPNPPMLDTESLYVILFGMLGLGSLRSLEKTKGVAAK